MAEDLSYCNEICNLANLKDILMVRRNNNTLDLSKTLSTQNTPSMYCMDGSAVERKEFFILVQDIDSVIKSCLEETIP